VDSADPVSRKGAKPPRSILPIHQTPKTPKIRSKLDRIFGVLGLGLKTDIAGVFLAALRENGLGATGPIKRPSCPSRPLLDFYRKIGVFVP
jgi:hypothetical protein